MMRLKKGPAEKVRLGKRKSMEHPAAVLCRMKKEKEAITI